MSWYSGMVKEHVISVICFSSLVFRVGCSRKQQAAQRNRDLIPAGENHENGRQRWRETPPCWHPDIGWEDRMGTSQRSTNERSQLLHFSISCHSEKFQTPWIEIYHTWISPLSRSHQQGLSGPDWELFMRGVSGWALRSGAQRHHQGPADAARWRPWEERGEPLVRQVDAGGTTLLSHLTSSANIKFVI